METAATRRESPTPNSAFCIVTLSASPATVMPVKRSGITAMLMASWLVRKHPRSFSGNATAMRPTPNIIAAVSLATSHGHCVASATSPRPSARPDSAPAASPIPMHGSTRVSMRLMSTFTAATSNVPRCPTIQYSAVMPVANSRLVMDVGTACFARVRRSSRVGAADANPIDLASVNPMRRYNAVPTHTETAVPIPAPTTPMAGTPSAGNPNMSVRLRLMFTACMASRVCM
mmetsp:Transcript_2657/g.6331  ORF Transcript_2657/g.6331 Transcript_2657/m.6331 type:complete len:231 (-) Transcript_2657:798-1490(-)